MFASRAFLPKDRWSACLFAVMCVSTMGACGGYGGASGEFGGLAEEHLPTIDGVLQVSGLQAEVEIVRDPWGVPHIYAQNLDDLFFAQGFVQAQDRLWQMEMYRRAGEGRLAEVLGPDAIRHDRLARSLKYRGPWTEEEFSSYHPEGRRILEAFAAGVNAYMDSESEPLPVEFALTGIHPEPWTAETPLLRMQTAMPLADARREIGLAMQVNEHGAVEANRRARPSPYRDLVLPSGVDLSLIGEELLDAIRGFQSSMARPALVAPYSDWVAADSTMNDGAQENSPGSNNWALSPELTGTGSVLVANDPHRGVTNPSLRYVVHLDAPGWTAIGSTEPVLPGVAIGHNGRVGWGLTIVGTDQTDIYVEEVHPDDSGQVRWGDGWESLTVVVDTIFVKGAEPEVVTLEYSRHGPIVYRDEERGLAYALRSTMHEPGSTGYLSALRLNVVDNCREFLEELRYWKAPTENMICGDADGNISWQASAASPRRSNWHGRLPVPGTGSYEWDGFRSDLPEEYNPDRGWVGTANHDIHPPGFDPPLFFKSGTSYPRFERVAEVLTGAENFGVAESRLLQLDAYFAPAARILGFFRGWEATDSDVEEARALVAGWDAVFDRESGAAALYDRVRRQLPAQAEMEALDLEERRDRLEEALRVGLAELTAAQGDDPSEWRWGRSHNSQFPHSLVGDYDLPTAERSGGAGTVAATGATYRHIIDFSDLDGSLATNAPGQSARPGSPYYGNLLESWANGEYFPLLFSREAVAARAEHTLVLRPGTGSRE